MLRKPENEMIAKAKELNSKLLQDWKSKHESVQEENLTPTFQIFELYSPLHQIPLFMIS